MTSAFGRRSFPEPCNGHSVAVAASENFSNPPSRCLDAPEDLQRRFWRPLRSPGSRAAFGTSKKRQGPPGGMLFDGPLCPKLQPDLGGV